MNNGNIFRSVVIPNYYLLKETEKAIIFQVDDGRKITLPKTEIFNPYQGKDKFRCSTSQWIVDANPPLEDFVYE